MRLTIEVDRSTFEQAPQARHRQGFIFACFAAIGLLFCIIYFTQRSGSHVEDDWNAPRSPVLVPGSGDANRAQSGPKASSPSKSDTPSQQTTASQASPPSVTALPTVSLSRSSSSSPSPSRTASPADSMSTNGNTTSARPRILVAITAAGKKSANAATQPWDTLRTSNTLVIINEFLTKYTADGYNVDIRIDTLANSSVERSIEAGLLSPLPPGTRVGVFTHDPASFPGDHNPNWLSGVHRTYMHLARDPIDPMDPPLTSPYDYYIYTEDDVLIPLAALRMVVQHAHSLWRRGRTLQLYRTEVDGNGTVVLLDWYHRVPPKSVLSFTENSTTYHYTELTDFPHAARGSFVLPGYAFGAWVADGMRAYFTGYRPWLFGPPERFGHGFMSATGQSHVPLALLDRSPDGAYSLHNDACLPHLSNNYWQKFPYDDRKRGATFASIPVNTSFIDGGVGAAVSDLQVSVSGPRWSGAWDPSRGWV